MDSTPSKVKLMCSYGGKIQSRPHDHALIYSGGDTKILTVDRAVKFRDMISKLTALSNSGSNPGSKFCIKYQLPGEGLDALVSVMDDDDVEHLMVEYDRMQRITKPARLRLFLFPLNRTGSGLASTPTPDFLFGFDEYPVSRDNHVSGWSYGFPGTVVYRMPVPVYNYLPVVSGHVAVRDESKGGRKS